MRDQSLSLTEAIKWLGCSTEEIGDYLANGLLKTFQGGDAADPQLSLNSVVILAESLPVERGIFRVRDSLPSDSTASRSTVPSYPGPNSFSKPRSTPIVERRPLRTFPRSE